MLRIFKLANKWPALDAILGVMWNTSGDIATFSVLLALFLFIFAIVGEELFSGIVKFNQDDIFDLNNGTSPRYNFDDFANAMLTSFMMLIGEAWGNIFLPFARNNTLAGVVYIVLGTFILNILFLNVFLAILLQNLFVDPEKAKMEEEDRINKDFEVHKRRISSRKISRHVEKYHKQKTLITILKTIRIIIWLSSVTKKRAQPMVEESKIKGTSLNFFEQHNPIRAILSCIVKSVIFKYISFFVIAINSVVLTYETPLDDPNGQQARNIFYVNIGTFIFFVIEIIAKVISDGLIVNGEESYLRNSWNVLDFIITIVNGVELAINPSQYATKKILMLFRVLRTLKIFSLNEGFLLCLRALVYGYSSIFQTLLIGLMFFTFFSIIGTNLFSGIFYYCDTGNLPSSPTILNIYDCENYGGEWRDRDVVYNNVAMGILAQFEMFTGHGFVDMVGYLTDAVDVDIAPVYKSHYNRVYFLVIFMIFGFMFFRATLTGVVSDSFFKQKEIIQGIYELTVSQRKWVRLSQIIFKATAIRQVLISH